MVCSFTLRPHFRCVPNLILVRVLVSVISFNSLYSRFHNLFTIIGLPIFPTLQICLSDVLLQPFLHLIQLPFVGFLVIICGLSILLQLSISLVDYTHLLILKFFRLYIFFRVSLYAFTILLRAHNASPLITHQQPYFTDILVRHK